MNARQERRLVELFNNKKFLRTLQKHFDRSFHVTVSEDEGTKKLRIQFVNQDNGQPLMTSADVAALVQSDTRTIRRWCEARAQEQAEFPIPFFRMNGLIRFERAKIEAWIKQQADAPKVRRTPAAKERKSKK
jgi:predicted DNA-binding transcriptional regulator AlpA